MRRRLCTAPGTVLGKLSVTLPEIWGGGVQTIPLALLMMVVQLNADPGQVPGKKRRGKTMFYSSKMERPAASSNSAQRSA